MFAWRFGECNLRVEGVMNGLCVNFGFRGNSSGYF